MKVQQQGVDGAVVDVKGGGPWQVRSSFARFAVSDVVGTSSRSSASPISLQTMGIPQRTRLACLVPAFRLQVVR